MEEKKDVQDVLPIESVEIEPLSDEDLENASGGANDVIGVCSAVSCSNSSQL